MNRSAPCPKIFFLAPLLLMLQSASASFVDFSFGTGVYNEHIAVYQTTVGGKKNKMDHRLFFTTGARYQWSPSWSIRPKAGLLWPFGTTEDEFTHKYSYYFDGLISFDFNERISLMAGPGLYLTTITGDGGSANLPNGDGYTSFPAPKGTSIARNITANIGLETFFYEKEFSALVQVSCFNLLGSRNRSFSYSLAAQYHFGDSLWN